MNELFSSSKYNKAKILLIAGFLGSGKTTLVKNILSWKQDLSDTVVLVNEFGQVGIDGTILKKAGTDVIELTNGCICCTLKTDLVNILKEVWERFNPKRILVETSGVADPGSVVSGLNDEFLKQKFEIYRVIVVLDARLWMIRTMLGTIFFKQLEEADLILLNKIDLIDAERIPQFLEEIHTNIPGCPILPVISCQIDPEALWTDEYKNISGAKLVEFFRREQIEIDHVRQTHCNNIDHESNNKCLANHHEGQEFVAFHFSQDKPLNEKCFKRFIERAPLELFRIKGSVRFPDRTMLLNFVGGKDDWDNWDNQEGTHLTFVGWKVNPEEVIKNLKQCIS